METTPAPKLSMAKAVGFRPGALREKLDALSAATGRDISDILRDGITAYWPEIEALNTTLGRSASPQEVTKVREWIDACTHAAKLGIDPRATLVAAAETKLEEVA